MKFHNHFHLNTYFQIDVRALNSYIDDNTPFSFLRNYVQVFVVGLRPYRWNLKKDAPSRKYEDSHERLSNSLRQVKVANQERIGCRIYTLLFNLYYINLIHSIVHSFNIRSLKIPKLFPLEYLLPNRRQSLEFIHQWQHSPFSFFLFLSLIFLRNYVRVFAVGLRP